MMNGLILMGGGGHCKSVIEALPEKMYDPIVVTDPDLPEGMEVLGCRVVGSDFELKRLYQDGFREAFVTVGSITNNSLRHILYERVKSENFSLVNVIDRSAVIAQSARLEKGIFVGKKCVVNAGCRIEEMVIINTGAILEHECSIGAFSHVSIGAILCGDVTVGKDVFVGAGAVITQGLSIKSGAVVGAGSIVLRNVEAGEKVTGVVK